MNNVDFDTSTKRLSCDPSVYKSIFSCIPSQAHKNIAADISDVKINIGIEVRFLLDDILKKIQNISQVSSKKLKSDLSKKNSDAWVSFNMLLLLET